MEYIVLYPSKPKSKGAGVTGGLTPEQAGTELTKNPDGYRGSIYMSKDVQGKLMMGPMWDYNEAFGLLKINDVQGKLMMGPMWDYNEAFGLLKINDVQGKLMMGPMWDYNEAFGTCCGYPIQGFLVDGNSTGSSGGSAISPQGWRFNICDEPSRCIADPIDGVSLWYRKAWQSADFRRSVASRWRDLRGKGGALSEATLANTLAAAVALTAEAAQRNYM
eukprot:gene25962-11646_t